MSLATKRRLPNVNNQRNRLLNPVLFVKFNFFCDGKYLFYGLEYRKRCSRCSTKFSTS